MARIPLKSRWNTVRAGLSTILGISPRGFFIPFRHAASVPANPPVYAEIEAHMASNLGALENVLESIANNEEPIAAAASGPLQGHWNGGYFGPLDTAAAFAITRGAAPKQIIEVGSGSSTHVLRAAAPDAEIRCIDPAPRKEISDLGVSWQEGVLTDEHVGLFADLEPDDIAFFDSSHVLVQGSDVDIIQNRILPIVPKGVLVHIHDIFLPDAYPLEWAHRAYTEHQGLAGWICGGAYQVLFSSHYAATRMTEPTIEALKVLPPHGKPGGGSLWMRRL